MNVGCLLKRRASFVNFCCNPHCFLWRYLDLWPQHTALYTNMTVTRCAHSLPSQSSFSNGDSWGAYLDSASCELSALTVAFRVEFGRYLLKLAVCRDCMSLPYWYGTVIIQVMWGEAAWAGNTLRDPQPLTQAITTSPHTMVSPQSQCRWGNRRRCWEWRYGFYVDNDGQWSMMASGQWWPVVLGSTQRPTSLAISRGARNSY